MSPLAYIAVIIAIAVVLFISNRLPVVVVAIGTALALWATQVLTLNQALGGFGDPAERFAQMDKNGDGKLTEDEIPEQAKQFLSISRLDTNKNNAIDKDEWMKSMEEMRQRMGTGGGPGGGGPGGGGPRNGGPAVLGAPSGGVSGRDRYRSVGRYGTSRLHR